MPAGAIVTLVFGVVLIAVAITLTVISFKKTKQHLSANIDGHTVELDTGLDGVKFVASLKVDGKVVDEVQSYKADTVKLQAKLGEKDVIVNIGTGLLGLKIATYFSGNKINDLSNY